MMPDNRNPAGRSSHGALLNSVLDRIKGFGRRLFVHFCAVIVAAIVSGTIPAGLTRADGASIMFPVYTGLICLFPRGAAARPAWFVPVISGLSLCLFWTLFGMPWQFVIIWGGALAWTVHAIHAKGALGWDWSALPWLLISLWLFFSEIWPTFTAMPPIWTFPLFAAAGWGVLTVLDRRAASLEQAAREPAGSGKNSEAGAATPEDPLAIRLREFAGSARALDVKKATLPEDPRKHVAGIAKAAQGIIICMRDDPEDVAAGDKFLARYLKAAHTVVDEHLRLSELGAGNPKIDDALARSRELLARLEAAFAQEHNALLQNDVRNFTVELNVLDKLLKMEGR